MRAYFKLKEPLDVLCAKYGKKRPTRDQLKAIPTRWTFYADQYRDTVTKGGPMSEGMLFAIAAWLETPPEDILVLVRDVPVNLLPNDDIFLVSTWDALVKLWVRPARLHRRSHLTSEKEVRDNVSQILLELGWLILQSKYSSPPHHGALIEAATAAIGIEQQPFTDMFVRWWQHNSMTVLAAYAGNNTHCGATVILPLQEAAYNRLASGEIRDTDIEERDLCFQGTHFFGVAGCDFSYRLVPTNKRRNTVSVATCFMAQLAAGLDPNRARELKVLSFAPTTIAYERLVNTGFEPLNRNMAGTLYELMELNVQGLRGTLILTAISMARHALDYPR